MTAVHSPPGGAGSLLRNRAFRRLLAGEASATIAEQLFLVTLTLLVLDEAGAGAALGTVLAIAAIPRGLLLPLGGLLADRAPPAFVAVVTTWLRTAVLALLAVLVIAGPPPLWAIALLAGLLGMLDAAYYPASLALLPDVVPARELAPANSLLQGAESAGDLLGPVAAAGSVAAFGLGAAMSGVAGLYALSAVALTAFARRHARSAPSASERPAARALLDGLRFAWGDPVIRVILLVLVALNVAVIGPILVGGAVLADERLGGEGQLGVLFSGFGAGSLAGLLAAGIAQPARRGLLLIAGVAILGVGLAAFGLMHSLWTVVPVAAVMGLAGGYLGVVLVAWLQERVPAEMRGRVMSLVVFAAIALDPLSYALAGALLPAGLAVLFAVSGALVLACAGLALASRAVRGLL